uniref:TetR/AcrR family transcriptional regulator n=1 Tax=Solimonas variicoloris TaxID=254408 RepID=UPI00037A42DC
MSKRVVKTVKGHRHGRVPRAFREEQLLDVAQALFAKQGYQGTSIEDIAAAAGVTRPMVYNYFESKDGIYLVGPEIFNSPPPAADPAAMPPSSLTTRSSIPT